jgi:uncharacterized OB-fold protein
MTTQLVAGLAGTRLGGEAFETREDGRVTLIGGVCRDCGNHAFPRSPVCCVCMSENIAAEAMPGIGTIYAFSTVHVGAKKWKKPMCVGYIDLPNGPRVFAHLDGDSLKIGDSVEPFAGIVGEDENGPIETFVFRKMVS